jgi:uncharacterized repeat protein (TIGR03837 family)
MPPPVPRWDLFCRVIDNFGDVGVCWRLARQLAHEHGLVVTLWLDDLRALARMAPACDPQLDGQRLAGVLIRHWQPGGDAFALSAEGVADVVVEGFGCGLPERYVAAMAQRAVPPHWFVLEYLSAEAWVDGTHGRASPHPALGLPRRFWFPGFTGATGGLLRETGLLAARDRFADDGAAVQGLWRQLGVPPPSADGLRISLFCYPNPQLPALLDAWAGSDRPVTCLVPEGVAVDALAAWAGGRAAASAAEIRREALAVYRIPFVAQDDYDRLLWACDVNFVRGEDSFVRAQWAGKPFVWHVYPQAEGAHLAKLQAFVDRCCGGIAEDPAAAVGGLFDAWNGVPGAPPIGPAWRDFAAALPAFAAHARAWSGELARLPELGAGLVRAAQRGV